jgi:RecA-family ATPase
METKEQLIKAIKEWVKIDNDIRTLKNEQNKRKKDKLQLSTKLIEIMRTNEIDCFDINNGQICYSKKSIKKPLTQKVLLDTLSKYFNGDLLKASEMQEFISENREVVVKESITRKINKTDEELN